MQRITIVGMGPIGASLGLALKQSKLENIEIVGTSGDKKNLSAASKMGAVDSTTGNLRKAVTGAQVVIFDSPLHEMSELLDAVGPILENGAVVTDTGSSKIRVLDWAQDSIPRTASFVAGHPLIRHTMNEVADADPVVFRGIEYCIIPSRNAGEDAVRTVVRLVEAIGSKTVFLDPHEHDSYVAAMNHLPMVMSTAFVTATAGSGAWREMHRLAASDFSDFSRLASNDPAENEVASMANPEALVHWLDQVITELYSYRNQIKEQNKELLGKFINAWEARARWQAGAVVDRRPGLNTPKSNISSLIMGERLADRFAHLSPENTKRDSWEYRGRRSSTEDEADSNKT